MRKLICVLVVSMISLFGLYGQATQVDSEVANPEPRFMTSRDSFDREAMIQQYINTNAELRTATYDAVVVVTKRNGTVRLKTMPIKIVSKVVPIRNPNTGDLQWQTIKVISLSDLDGDEVEVFKVYPETEVIVSSLKLN